MFPRVAPAAASVRSEVLRRAKLLDVEHGPHHASDAGRFLREAAERHAKKMGGKLDAWSTIDVFTTKLESADEYLEQMFAVPGALVPKEGSLQAWQHVVWACEAGIRVLEPRRHDPSSARLLMVAEWTLFLTLTAPLRLEEGSWGSGPWQTSTAPPAGRPSGAAVDIVSVYRDAGTASAEAHHRRASVRYLTRVRQLRSRLVDDMLHFQDHPLLRECDPRDLERIARLLVFAAEDARRLLVLPQGLPFDPERELPATEPDKPSAELVELVERFFLPRFDLYTAWRAASMQGLTWPSWRVLLPVLGVVATLIGAALFVVEWPEPWMWTIWPVWSLVVMIGALLLYVPFAFAPKLGAMAGLLRVPPSVAIGVLLALTLDSQWWAGEGAGLSRWQFAVAAAVLLAVAFGYLYTEARGHDVDGRQAAARAWWVFLIVVLNALLVTLVSLACIFPVFSPSGGQSILGVLAHSGWWQRSVELAAVVSLATVVGLFSQVLWDEKTITAPLAHMTWRR